MRFFFLFILSYLFFTPILVLATTDSQNFDLNLTVTGCNNNGTCEAGLGETTSNCTNDCPVIGSGGGAGGGYAVPPSVILPPSITVPSSSIVTTTTITTTTLVTPEVILSNILNLRTEAGDSFVRLSWKNPPSNTGYIGVLVRRSISFYPIKVTSGGLLYKGAGTNLGNGQFEYVDTGLKNGQRYFYTIFAYNLKGEYTSGASVSALPQSAEQQKAAEELVIPPQELPPEIGLPLIPIPKDIAPILFNDFHFIQDGQSLINTDSEVQSKIDKPLIIYLDGSKVPSQTDVIILTTQDISQENALPSSFLFRKDTKTGRYQLILPAQPNIGRIKTTITFVDKNLVAIRRLTGFIEIYSGPLIEKVIVSTTQIVSKPSVTVQVKSSLMVLKDFIIKNLLSVLILITISLLLLLLKYLTSRLKK